jgi:hypothetical protein
VPKTRLNKIKRPNLISSPKIEVKISQMQDFLFSIFNIYFKLK